MVLCLAETITEKKQWWYNRNHQEKTFIFQEFSIISQSRSVQISTKIAAGLRIRVGVDGFLDTRKLTRNSE